MDIAPQQQQTYVRILLVFIRAQLVNRRKNYFGSEKFDKLYSTLKITDGAKYFIENRRRTLLF